MIGQEEQEFQGICGDAGGNYCYISGDPHTCTFDGTKHHFQGEDYDDDNNRQGYYYVDGAELNNNLLFDTDGLPFDLIGYHHPCFDEFQCLEYLVFRFYYANIGDGTELAYALKMRAYNSITEEEDLLMTLYPNFVDKTGDEFLFPEVVSSAGLGYFDFDKINDGGVDKLRLRVRYDGLAVEPIDHTFTDCDDCDEFHFIVELWYQGNEASRVDIWISDTFAGRSYGLCGTNDGQQTNDVPFRSVTGTPFDRRRRLLQTGNSTIEYLDGSNMQYWTDILASRDGSGDDAWIKTRIFGDSWLIDPRETDYELPPLPTNECVNAATTFCTYLWNDDFNAVCNKCDTFERFNLNFDSWLQDCIFDSCMAAIANGVNLQDISYNQALNNGYFDMSIGDCAGSCATVPGLFYLPYIFYVGGVLKIVLFLYCLWFAVLITHQMVFSFLDSE